MTIQLWRSFGNYSNQYSYSTWAYRIALNVAISFYRKETRRKQISQPAPDNILYFIDTHKAEAMEENISFLMKFIAGLREIDKGLMLLYLEEKPYKEIASIMGLSESNVATKIGRIKTELKIKFANLQKR
jgi:RNA polymerase sigma factor (sigma-70 family)